MHGAGCGRGRFLLAISLVIATRWALLIPQLAQGPEVLHFGKQNRSLDGERELLTRDEYEMVLSQTLVSKSLVHLLL